MMKGLMVDDNMSNLTFASGEISASSSTRNDQSVGNLYPQNSSASTNQLPPPPNKKKRSLPGNPDPDAEVIALSPKTLLATNRFICEICNKGFQRDQNLQLHRRGHNLPWKLKQRSNKEVIRKKVYVCPEASCVHHDPSRALGDLTGIKKHFFRKHGEKKWKCDKCSKRYAVQSDWKAHSKICGTREYRCDCGTLFSRRDSFITHRAFCDALAQESSSTSTTTARAMTAIMNPLQHQHQHHHHHLSSSSSQQLVLPQHIEHHLHGGGAAIKREVVQDLIPPWLACPPPQPPPPPSLQPPQPLMQFSSPNNPTSTLLNIQAQPPPPPPPPQAAASPFASATALLQKAAQMGSTMSNRAASFLKAQQAHQAHHYLASESNNNNNMGTASGVVSGLGLSCENIAHEHDHDHDQFRFGNDYEEMMSSLSAAVAPPMPPPPPAAGINAATPSGCSSGVGMGVGGGHGGGNDGLTRDFLGLRTFPHRDIFNIVGLDHINSSAYGSDHPKHDHHQPPWQG
ncbi:TFIIH C1-like domain containing protein [Trema orientale]|uniref:TFIIH C1-like domain containing protein n=1 Tax=Trema orientale TaxID=63057 RepID=A0A2P5FDZ7_TREOI|nr:TFIIH C1-like domain containing protein [Trema orientale]